MEATTLYDALKQCESADTNDNTFDAVVCYDLYDDMSEPLDLCMTAVQKRIGFVKSFDTPYGGVELVADIAGFVKENMGVLREISKEHRWMMHSVDKDDDESVYIGVTIVNAMETGDASEDEYLTLLKVLEPQQYEDWVSQYGRKWLKDNEQYLDMMMQGIVKDIKEKTKEE